MVCRHYTLKHSIALHQELYLSLYPTYLDNTQTSAVLKQCAMQPVILKQIQREHTFTNENYIIFEHSVVGTSIIKDLSNVKASLLFPMTSCISIMLEPQ